ncbi:MAG TPA: efflux RND transporter periplasmic adaptor subunit, partial [Quisquiliibacterium sp.]|nr:efflux RND transporter periplasmic adaptor subunit [Quisquiliibacterium sp.]
GLFALALVGGLAFVIARTGPFASTRVTVAEVTEEAVAPAVFGIGIVEARRTWMIGPTAPGRVATVSVDVGDQVRAGQQLAEMDPVDLDERAQSLDAAVARAGSAAAAARAQVDDAAARSELAAINARRYAELGKREFVSPSVVQAREQERVSAAAAHAAAQANLAAARQELVRLQADRAAIAQQRLRTRLTAPADGLVVSRDAEPGSTVVAGQAVVRIADPATLWIRTRIDQGRSAGLRTGLPASITMRSSPGLSSAGRVARLEPLSDSITEERIAQVAFDSRPEGVAIGELAEVTLRTDAPGKAGPTVPNAALRRQGEARGVWALRDGALRFVPLQVVAAGLDGRVQVSGDLKAGERVILYSEKPIGAGSRIEIVESLSVTAR